MSDTNLWYRDYWKRMRSRDEFERRNARTPCVHWYWADGLNEVEELIYSRVAQAGRILDFGAGEARLKAKFLAKGFGNAYETLDLSEEHRHTYRSLNEAQGKFDAIICLEVVEHMTLNESVRLFDAFQDRLSPGGVFVLSTPNPACIVPMWSADAGHVQQFPLADLAAEFVMRGFDVEAFRVRLGRRPQGIAARARFMAQRILCYLLGVDYAHGLLIVARLNGSRC